MFICLSLSNKANFGVSRHTEPSCLKCLKCKFTVIRKSKQIWGSYGRPWNRQAHLQSCELDHSLPPNVTILTKKLYEDGRPRSKPSPLTEADLIIVAIPEATPSLSAPALREAAELPCSCSQADAQKGRSINEGSRTHGAPHPLQTLRHSRRQYSKPHTTVYWRTLPKAQLPWGSKGRATGVNIPQHTHTLSRRELLWQKPK